MMLLLLLWAQATTTSPSGSPLHPLLLGAAVVAWCALWAQVIVIPFYNRRESLSKDYHASGRMNTAIAAIESNRLIKSLAAMFNRAQDSNPDRRTRPDIETLLDSTLVLPDLKQAQAAMVDIEELHRCYGKLCLKSGRLWKWTLLHLLLSLAIFGEFSLGQSLPWFRVLLLATAIPCGLTFAVVVYGFFAFHNLISSFNSTLEKHERGTE